MQEFHNKCRYLLAATGLMLASVAAAQDQDILRPQEAFRYAVADSGSAIEIDWALEDGYYLYKNKLSFVSNTPSISFGEIELPEGQHHEDEFFGVQQVYRQRFYVSIPYTVAGERPAALQLDIKSQGCADIGICYPPQTWSADVELVAQTALPAAKLDLGESFGSLGANGDFLPVDEAFQPLVTALDGNTVEVAIRVTPGYYLYRDKITAVAESDRVQAGRLDLPAGELKVDEWFGEMEVYHDDVIARLPLARATPDSMQLSVQVGFQGCADGGICYPP